MKVLRELLPVAGKKNVLDRLNSKAGEATLTQKLLELVEDMSVSDDRAAKLLYGPSANRKLAAFKTLKTRLRDIMIVAIQRGKVMELDYSTYDAAYTSGFRQLNTINVLLKARAYTALREIAKHTFFRVKDYEIIPLNHSLTNFLSYMNLGVNYNEERFRKYNDLNRYYSEAAYVLYRLEDRFRIIRDMTYAHRKSFLEVGQLALSYLEEFKDTRGLYLHVSQIQGLVYNLEITGFMYVGKYKEAIRSSKEGEAVLRKCKGVSNTVFNFLLLTRLESILKAENFDLGRKEITNAQSTLPKNSINGLKVVEYAIRLGLRMKEYEYAYLSLANLNRKLINRLLTPRHQEYWMIWEAYVNFLVLAGKVQPQEDWPKLPKFKFAKFFNNVPTYSRNKTGMNIPILILQAMYFIVGGKFGKVVDRTEALERYCSRYLKNDENLRHNCFFKLLVTTVQANFHRGATERKAAKVYSKMINAKESSFDIEIVPYETLWEIVLENLTVERRSRAKLRDVGLD